MCWFKTKSVYRGATASPGMYGFVHRHLALANSAGGKYCGVDSEMQILGPTPVLRGFHACPAAPHQPRFPASMRLRVRPPLEQRKPHARDQNLLSAAPHCGNLYRTSGFQMATRVWGLRCRPGRRRAARITRRTWHACIAGRGHWRARRPTGSLSNCTARLYSLGSGHAIGEPAAFLEEALEYGDRTGDTRSISQAEAFNIAMAAVTGARANRETLSDYLLHPMRGVRSCAPKALPSRQLDRRGRHA